MDENTKAKFQEKIKTPCIHGKRKKNVLEYQEISDHFVGFTLEEEQMDEDSGCAGKVKLVSTCCALPMMMISDEELLLYSDEDEVDMENLDLKFRTMASASRIRFACT